MTDRWRCHGSVAAMMLATLALAACDGGSGGDDAHLDAADEGCGCQELPMADLPRVDQPSPDAIPPDAASPELPAADVPSPDIPSPEVVPDDVSTADVPSPDLPPTDAIPEDAQATDLPPADPLPVDLATPDPAAVDQPGEDLREPDLPPTDVALQDALPVDAPATDPAQVDPGLPPATLGKVSPAALKAELEHKDFLLINVHVPYDGEIPGTDRHITFEDIDAIAAYLGSDLDMAAVLYCLSNYMSTLAGRELVKRGYRNLRYLDGGMAAWKAAGYPFEAP